MKKIVFLFLILNCFLSCKKDKIDESPEAKTSRYYPLSVGNYWIYQNSVYNLDTYTATTTNDIDSIKITGTKMIGGDLYYEVVQNRFTTSSIITTSYVRDSSGFIVDSNGDILFTLVAFDEILHTYDGGGGILVVNYSIQDSLSTIITPLDVYECYDFKGELIHYADGYIRDFHNYYAEDIGLVYQSKFLTVFAGSSFNREYRRELIDYHLEE